MKKRKKRNVVEKGRKLIQVVKTTIFGEKLKSAIDTAVAARKPDPGSAASPLITLPPASQKTPVTRNDPKPMPKTDAPVSCAAPVQGGVIPRQERMGSKERIGKPFPKLKFASAKKPPSEVTAKAGPVDDPLPECVELKQESTPGDRGALIKGRGLDPQNVKAYRNIIEAESAKTLAATLPWIKLGVDLGTSSSKVVWRGENVVKALCFGLDRLDLNDYLFPSVVSFHNQDIKCGFEAASLPFRSRISHFKMCLACISEKEGECGPDKCSLTLWKHEHFCQDLIGEEVEFVNAYYLAHLFSATKRKIISELENEFAREVNPKWTVNLAVPETFIEQSPIAAKFGEVLRTAWFMSEVLDVEPKLADRMKLFECYLAAKDVARESLRVLSYSDSGEPIQVLSDSELGCTLYPEIGAEVASIVMSRTSEVGLYAFVDVGAGTVDASVFRYFRDGKTVERPPSAAAVSKDLGAAHVELRASQYTYSGVGFSIADLKALKDRKEALTVLERNENSRQLSIIDYVSKTLGSRLQHFLESVFRNAREKEPDIVNQEIRLVLGGGGSDLTSYQDAARKAFTIKSAVRPVEPELRILKKPNDFDMSPLPEANFHRFAVAYGLSFPFEDLPKPILTKDVLPVAHLKKSDRNLGAMYEK